MGRRCFKVISKYIDYILSIIYGGEDKCLLCDEYVEEEYMCNRCNNKIKFLNLCYCIEDDEDKFTCYSLGAYGYELKKLIMILKYKKVFRAGEILGNYMSNFIQMELLGEVDVLTYIPSSKEALKRRGFNQCEIICKNISKKIDIPFKQLTEKIRENSDQIGLNNEQRWNNMRNTFTVVNNEYIRNKRILLIDDVLTTGATAFYCAKEIKKSGAKEVYILTIAKSRV